jgi:hypothetical protein
MLALEPAQWLVTISAPETLDVRALTFLRALGELLGELGVFS